MLLRRCLDLILPPDHPVLGDLMVGLAVLGIFCEADCQSNGQSYNNFDVAICTFPLNIDNSLFFLVYSDCYSF